MNRESSNMPVAYFTDKSGKEFAQYMRSEDQAMNLLRGANGAQEVCIKWQGRSVAERFKDDNGEWVWSIDPDIFDY